MLDHAGLALLAEPKETLVQAMQAPWVLRVLAGAAQGAVEPEIGAIDALRLLDAPLLEKQRAEGMTQ